MVKFYISWEKYVAKTLFSVIVLIIAGFIFGPSVYFQFSKKIDVVLAADVGYGGGNIYCPTIPGKSPAVTLSSTSQSVNLGGTVTFTVTAVNFDGPSYSITDSFGGTTITANNISSGTFTWVPTSSDVGVHNLSISVKDSCNAIGQTVQVTVVAPPSHPFLPKFPNTGAEDDN